MRHPTSNSSEFHRIIDEELFDRDLRLERARPAPAPLSAGRRQRQQKAGLVPYRAESRSAGTAAMLVFIVIGTSVIHHAMSAGWA